MQFSNLSYLESLTIQQSEVNSQVLIENFSIIPQTIQFNVSSTNALSDSPYLYKLDGIAPVTLNVNTAKINITVPLKAKSYVLNLYGYSNNQNATNLFVYAKNSSGNYVLVGSYIIPQGPFELNIPLSSSFIVNKVVSLLLNSTQLANFAASSLVNTNNYVIVTIFNYQNVATPKPFQQEINLSATSQIAQLVEPNASNVAFTYLNGTIIPSWFEGKDSHGDFIWWIKLAGGIPADSWITIKMILAPWNVNFYQIYKGYVGEAPQLSPLYGEYDDGQNVFNFYDNFTRLNTQIWSEGGNTSSIIVKDGLTINCIKGQTAYIYSKLSIYDNNVVEAFGNITTTSAKSGQQETFGLGDPNLSNYILFNSTSPSNINKVSFDVAQNNQVIGEQQNVYNPGIYVWTIELIKNNVYGYQNYSSKTIITDQELSSFSQAIYFYCYNKATGVGLHSLVLGPFYWVRVRAPPPNGVMPKVIFGYLVSTMIGTRYIKTSIQSFTFSKIAITTSLTLPLMNYTTYYPNSTNYYLNTWQGTSFTFTYKNIERAASNISLWLDFYNPSSSSKDSISVQASNITRTYLLQPHQEERVCISLPSSAVASGFLSVKVTANVSTMVKEAILQAIVPHVIVANVGSYPISIIRIWANSSPPRYFNVSITLLPGQQVDLSNYFVQGSSIIKVVTSDGRYYSFYY